MSEPVYVDIDVAKGSFEVAATGHERHSDAAPHDQQGDLVNVHFRDADAVMKIEARNTYRTEELAK